MNQDRATSFECIERAWRLRVALINLPFLLFARLITRHGRSYLCRLSLHPPPSLFLSLSHHEETLVDLVATVITRSRFTKREKRVRERKRGEERMRSGERSGRERGEKERIKINASACELAVRCWPDARRVNDFSPSPLSGNEFPTSSRSTSTGSLS